MPANINPGQNTDGNTDPNNPAAQITARKLEAAEERAGSDPGSEKSNQKDTPLNSSSINQTEEQGSSVGRDGSFVNNVTTKSGAVKMGRKALLKRFGPTAGVGGIVGALIIALMGSFGPLSMFVNLKENAMTHWDQQSVSADSRAGRLLAKRLADADTRGCSGLSVRACSYTKPSDRMVRELTRVNIRAIDSSGNVIAKQRLIAGIRPAFYELPDGTRIAPKDFRTELQKNEKMRSAFRKAHNPRWVNWVDNVAMNYLGRIGASKAIPKALADDGRTTSPDVDGNKSTAQRYVDDVTKGTSVDRAGTERLVSEAAEDFADKTAKRVGASDTTLIGAAVGCSVIKAPGVISKVIRGYRMRQLAPLAITILAIADAIKAEGDNKTGTPYITPEQVSAAGDMLTQTYRTEGGDVIRSAMSSGAILYAITGDPRNATKLSSGSKYLPGAGGGAFGAAAAFGADRTVTSLCNAATSIEAQAAADAVKLAKVTNPAGWALLIGDLAILLAEKTGLLGFIVKEVVDIAVRAIGSIIGWDTVLDIFLGDDTEGLAGEPLGDAAGIYMEASMAELAAAGGNSPLTPEQKLAYDQQVTKPTQLAWAAEDRLNRSPLDMSSPNTALGSIVSKIVPLYLGNPTVGDKFLATVNVSVSSLSTFFGALTPAHANTDASLAKNWCEGDYLVRSAGVAASPLCTVQYGVPAEYLSMDPVSVVLDLTKDNQLDQAGEVKRDSDLEEWIGLCSGADTLYLDECVINSEETAKYALFQIDRRAADTMDNDPPDPSIGPETVTAEFQPGVCGAPATLAESQGQWGGYTNGQIPSSALKGISYDPSELLHPDAACSFEELNKAYKERFNTNISITDTYRSFAEQVAIKKSRGFWAATPGTSNHGWGLAMDLGGGINTFGSAQHQWMQANAPKYGWVHPPWAAQGGRKPEAWHWEFGRPVDGTKESDPIST